MNTTSRNKLVWNGVPTLFDVPNPPPTLNPKRKAPQVRLPSSILKRQKTSQDTAAVGARQEVNTDGAITESTIKLMNVKKKLKTNQQKVRRAKRVRMKHRFSSTICRCKYFEKLSPIQQKFINSQIRAIARRPRGVRWTDNDKVLALGLYYKSRAAYIFFSRVFILPSICTLRRFIRSYKLTVGFQNAFLETLRIRAESMNRQEKLIVLTFDSMSIKTELEYRCDQDRVIGFEELGPMINRATNTPRIAKHALQFMIRGISTKWKQVIGYFFTGNSIGSTILQTLVKDAIKNLETIGFTVVAIVCDQESSHQACMKDMNVTPDNPTFNSPSGNIVHVLFDIPHLIKNLRNNLRNYDIMTSEGSMEWDVLSTLYDLEKGSTLRLARKLTDRHLNLPPFAAMRVCLATQLLSFTVATAIRAYVRFGQLPESSLTTADGVEKIDKLFDILNSTSIDETKKWRKPLSVRTGDQFQFLTDMLTWIKTWTFRHRTTGHVKKTLPFHHGLLMSIQSMKAIAEMLLQQREFR